MADSRTGDYHDSEAITINHSELYRDDSDEDATLLPSNAGPIRDAHSPSPEFGGMQMAGSSKPAWRQRVAHAIPPGVKRAWNIIVTWVQGPKPPRIFSISPFFLDAQHIPLALLDRYAPKRIQRFWLLVFWYACWLLTFMSVLRASSISASIPGHGNPVRLNCETRYWSDGNGCGLNGDQCRPFTNATLAFRCPADCHKVLQLTPHAVGDQEVVYKPLLVGGPSKQHTGFEGVIEENAVYRGDSFVCASAVHAGFIKNSQGGCGVLALTGEQADFTASKRHGYESTAFGSYFPHSFGFLQGSQAQCKDLRWPLLGVSVFFSAVLSLFTTNPGVFFWTMFVGLFFHVGLVSDPPNLANYYDLLSIAFGRFLPASFCAWVTYRYSVKRSLTNLTAQIEKTILWLGPAWVGALNNYTFDRIPIQRLTPHDLQAQPGAIPALIIIVLSIFTIALGQAWSFRIEGRMPRYLLIYGLFVATLLIMVTLPGLSLRIHHYILALLFLPGTSFQNRPSLIYQGLLVGLFINGIARWGFDSILQTPGELLEGFQRGTLLPAVSVAAIGAHNITFALERLPLRDPKVDLTYDGISILVNDVERFRGYADDRSFWDDSNQGTGNFTWTWRRHYARNGNDETLTSNMTAFDSLAPALPPVARNSIAVRQADGDLEVEKVTWPEYFRFAYMAGNSVADFTKAGIWKADGSWQPMESGPS